MFVPHSFALALLMMITSAVCWGSWPIPTKASSRIASSCFT